MESIKVTQVVPVMALRSIDLANKGYEPIDALRVIAQMYRERAEHINQTICSFLPPCLLVIVGGQMALMCLALFMPMIRIMESLQ